MARFFGQDYQLEGEMSIENCLKIFDLKNEQRDEENQIATSGSRSRGNSLNNL
jgi:hypothetical protein